MRNGPTLLQRLSALTMPGFHPRLNPAVADEAISGRADDDCLIRLPDAN